MSVSVKALKDSKSLLYPLRRPDSGKSFWLCLRRHSATKKTANELLLETSAALNFPSARLKEPTFQDIGTLEQHLATRIIIIRITSLPTSGTRNLPSYEIIRPTSLPLTLKPLMVLHYSEQVYSLILDWAKFSRTSVKCPLCGKLCSKKTDLEAKHKCLDEPTVNFPPSVHGFRPHKTLFERLEDLCFSIHADLRFLEPVAIFDCESTFDRPVGQKEDVQAVHRCIMISVSTNVPGFPAVKTFTDLNDQDNVCSSFLSFVESVSLANYEQLLPMLQPTLDSIDAAIDLATDDFRRLKLLRKLRQDSLDHICKLRLYGMWSGTYDIPLILPSLMKKLENQRINCLKSGSKFLLLDTSLLSFRDISSYKIGRAHV